MGIVLWPFNAEDAEENGEDAEGGKKRTFLAAKSVRMSFSKAGSCVMLFPLFLCVLSVRSPRSPR